MINSTADSSTFCINENASDVIKQMAKDKTIACTSYDSKTQTSVFVTANGTKTIVDDDYNVLSVERDIDGSNIKEFEEAKKEEASPLKKFLTGLKGVVTDGIGGLLGAFKEHPVAATAATAGAVGAFAAVSAIPVVGPVITGVALAGLGVAGLVKAVKSGVENVKEAKDAEEHGNYIRAEKEYEEIGGDVFDFGLSAWGTVSGVNMAKSAVNAAKSTVSVADDALNAADDTLKLTQNATSTIDDSLNAADDTTSLTGRTLDITDDSIAVVDDGIQTVDDSIQTIDDSIQTVDDSMRTAETAPKPLSETDDALKTVAKRTPEEISRMENGLVEQLKDKTITEQEFVEKLHQLYKQEGIHTDALEGWAKDGKQLIQHYQVKMEIEDPARITAISDKVNALGNPELHFDASTMDDFSKSVKDLKSYIDTNAEAGTTIQGTVSYKGSDLPYTIQVSGADSTSGMAIKKVLIDGKGNPVTYYWIGTPKPSQINLAANGLPANSTSGIKVIQFHDSLSTVMPCEFKKFLTSLPSGYSIPPAG